jgi:hypothetical protein
MEEEDLNALRAAVESLEHSGFAARLGEIAGKPIELVSRALPEFAAQNRLRRFRFRSFSRIRRRIFLGIDDYAAMAQLSANPAIAIGFELIADCDHGGDQRSSVCRE